MQLSKADFTDFLTMGVITNSIIAATAFLFMHPTEPNFVTWAAVVSTAGGVYHWLTIRDAKQPDAGNGQ